jgi:flagellar motor protein MotB
MRTSILAVLLLGCVPKNRYEIAQIQLEATRTALSARTAGCYDEQTRKDDQIRSLEQEKARLQERVQDLADQVKALDASLAAARTSFASEQTAQLSAAIAALQDEEARTRHRSEEMAEIQSALQPLIDSGRLDAKVGQSGVRVQLPWDKLFQPGIEGLTPWGEALATDLAAAIDGLTGRRIRVEGHVDDPAFHSAAFSSSWELGFGRAMLVLRALQDHGLSLPAFAASYAVPMPGDEGPPKRVDVVIALRSADQ